MTGHGVSRQADVAPSPGVVVDQPFFHRDDRRSLDADRFRPRAWLDVDTARSLSSARDRGLSRTPQS